MSTSKCIGPFNGPPSPCCNAPVSIWEEDKTIWIAGEPLDHETESYLACDECGQTVDWPTYPDMDDSNACNDDYACGREHET
jgi:hypothetical protein